ETTPGPLILVTQFVAMLAGFNVGGWNAMILAGSLALFMTFIPCFLWIFAFGPALNHMTNAPRICSALASVTAAIVGVIANLSLWFAMHVFFGTVGTAGIGALSVPFPSPTTLQPTPVIIALLGAIGMFKLNLPLPLLILVAAILGAFVQFI
ncbi:MAG: chromate transporter, partial [Planktomarina sp.]